MDLLKRRIRNEAKAIGTDIVNVDSFLDHQLDIGLFMAIGKEIKSRFAHMGINKILTVEASGAAIAAITATYFDLVPVVFAKKTQPDNITEACYSTEINKEGIRKMTPREWARLQGFPDTYELPLADVHLYKQFGNSVTVNVIEAIAEKIKEVLDDG